MDFLRSCLQNQMIFFVIMNVLEFVMGLLLCLIPLKKAWQEYLVCVYGGYFFGIFPALYISESMSFMLVSWIILATGFCLVQYLYRESVYLPVLVVLAKAILIVGNIIWYETDFMWPMEYYFALAVFLSLIAYVTMNFVTDLAAMQSHFPLALFGAMELCGAMIQFCLVDYRTFDKLLHDGKYTLKYVFYVMKVDYSYFDYQMIFVMGLLAILAGYFVWNKIVQVLLAAYTERQMRYRMKG